MFAGHIFFLQNKNAHKGKKDTSLTKRHWEGSTANLTP